VKDPVATGIIATAVAAIATVLANWITTRSNRPKIEADAQGVHAATEKVAITNAADVLSIVNAAVDKAVAREHAECQASITALRTRINRLERTLNDNGIPIPIGDT
jgi:ammonia channel protein AmtB